MLIQDGGSLAYEHGVYKALAKSNNIEFVVVDTSIVAVNVV
ncbi:MULTISPECIES: hypothetical protein [Candidatus Nitrosocaldus]|nr:MULTISPECIES: hypothetical protein [Candidatus Nitrosocaldus]